MWFDAIKRGRTFVTTGPMLDFQVDEALPGDQITVDEDRPLHVRARAWGLARHSAPAKLRLVKWGLSKWFYAMKAIMDYMAYQRAGGDIDFVIFNNLANTHSQCVIDTPKEGVFITAAGVAMGQLAHSPAAWPLRFEGYEARFDDNFQISAAWDRQCKRLVLYVLNRTGQPRDVHFDLRSLGRDFRRAHTTTLWAQDSFAMNTLAQPDVIRREVLPPTRLAGSAEHQVTARPWSFTEITVER